MKNTAFRNAVLVLSVGNLSALAFAESITIPVEKDASIIRQSLCRSNAADTNFGSALTVDAGQYHHASEGLFGFNLKKLPRGAVIKKAELVLGSARIVGSEPAAMNLGSFWGDWNEATVTWNTRPANTFLSAQNLSSGINSIDVTSTVQVAYAQQQALLSFSLDAAGSSNVFISSKEDMQNQASYLLVDADLPTYHVDIRTDKDASLIAQTMSTPDAANKNFGSAASVDAGRYHHISQALFGFRLNPTPPLASLRKAVLSLNANLVGSTPATVKFGFAGSDWLENKVTFNTRPASEYLFDKELTAGRNEVDVTAIVQRVLDQRQHVLSLTVDASGAANVFFVSKEGDALNSATLSLDYNLPKAP